MVAFLSGGCVYEKSSAVIGWLSGLFEWGKRERSLSTAVLVVVSTAVAVFFFSSTHMNRACLLYVGLTLSANVMMRMTMMMLSFFVSIRG